MLKIYVTSDNFIQVEGDINIKIDLEVYGNGVDVDSLLILTNTGVIIEASYAIEDNTIWGFIVHSMGSSKVYHHILGSKENPYKHTEVIEIESDIEYIMTAPNPEITYITH